MFRLLTKPLKMFGFLRGTISPACVAYGICLGFFWGFMPQGPAELTSLLLLLLVIFTRQSIGFMLLVAGVCKGLMALGMWRVVAKTGRAVLEVEALSGFWSWLLDSPLLRLMQLERYTAMGGLLWALLASALVFYPAYKMSNWLYDSLFPRLGQITIIRVLFGGWLGAPLRLLFFGARRPKPKGEQADAEKASAEPAEGEDAEGASSDELESYADRSPPLIYWRLLIPCTILAIILEFFAGGPIVGYITRRVSQEEFNINVLLKNTQVSALSGKVGYDGFDAKRGGEDFISLDQAEVNVNMPRLLKGSLVVEEARVTNPNLRWVRGLQSNTGEQLSEAIKKKMREQDLVQDLMDKAREKLKELEEAQKKKESGKTPEQQLSPELAKLSPEDRALMGRASCLKPQPLAWIKKLICNGLTISMEDKLVPSRPLAIDDCSFSIENVSSDPDLIEEPVKIVFSAKLKGETTSKIAFDFHYDINTKRARISLLLEDIPMDWADPYVSQTFSLKFGKGTKGTLKLELMIQDGTILKARPLIRLGDINVSVRDPQKTRRIAGLEAERLCKELNTIGEIELNDITIYGSVDNPRIEYGDSLKNLVVMGARSYARNRANQEIDKGRAKLDKKLDGKLGKIEDKLDKKLGKHGVDTSGLKDVTKGGLDGVQKGAGGVLDGVLGNKKKGKDEGKDEAKKGEEKKGGLLDDVGKKAGGFFGGFGGGKKKGN